MDPLSITASAIGIGGLVKGLLKVGQTLRGIDDSALALLNELSDLEFVMHDVRHVFEHILEQDLVQSLPTSTLEQFLAQAQRYLEELDYIVQYDIVLAKSTDDAPKFNRRAWLQKRDRIQTLKDQLRETRMNIFTTLGMLGHCTGYSVQISLKEIRSELRAIRASPEATPPMLTYQNGTNYMHITDHQEAKLLDVTSSSSTKLLPAPTTASTKPVETASNPSSPSSAQKLDCGHEFRPISWSNIAPPTTYHSFEVRLVRAAGFKCDARCACRCHHHTQFRTPEALQHLVGSLFLGYSNIPLLTRGCNDRFCRRESSVAVSVIYTFPAWLCQRQLRIFSDKPEFLLRLSPVRPRNAAIFLYARKNYVPGLKRLLANGQASVSDVNEFGQNALWHAVAYEALDAVQFLMRISADARQTTQKGWSALHEAWLCVLVCKNSPFRRFFADRGDLEIFGFSKLHQAVLGLNGQDVQTALHYWQNQDIDIQDDTGFTPLTWAVSRNDQKAISLLLDQGADMNRRQPNTLTPLLLSTNLCEAFKHLELPGADLHVKDAWGNGLLHVIMKRNCLSMPKCFRCLDNILKAGVDVNSRNNFQTTPLHLACRFSSVADVEYLLEHGADLEAKTQVGATPLLTAVRFRNIKVMHFLLKRGANTHAVNVYGLNMLHYAAMYGDKALFETLSEWHLPAYLLRWRNRLRATPLDIIKQRTQRPWLGSFLDMAERWPGPNFADKKPPCLQCHKQAWLKAWNGLVESLAEGPEPHASMLSCSFSTHSIEVPKPKLVQVLRSPRWTHLSAASVDAIPFMHLSTTALTKGFYILLAWWLWCWLCEGKSRQSRPFRS